MPGGQGIVRSVPIVFGTPGTQTALLTGSGTSNVMNMPRENWTLQLNAYTTGTSQLGAAVRWQGSNDKVAWLDLASATASATNANGTGTTVNMAGIAYTNTFFAYGRAAVVLTGTGSSDLKIGF